MIIDCNYQDKNKGFSDLKNKELVNLFFELYKFLNRNNTLLSKFGISQIECNLNDTLRKLVNISTKGIFSNFSLVLRTR